MRKTAYEQDWRGDLWGDQVTYNDPMGILPTLDQHTRTLLDSIKQYEGLDSEYIHQEGEYNAYRG